jgi:GT2 family glycosyltransferase
VSVELAAPSVRVDVCIVLFRPDWGLLGEALEALGRNDRTGLVRIHLNGDVEGDSAERLQALVGSHDLTLRLSSSSNVGFAAGQNRLLSEAFADGAQYALVLNPDLLLDDVGLRRLIAASIAVGDRHLVSGALLLRERGDDARRSDSDDVDTTGIVWTRTSRHLDRDQGRSFSMLELPEMEVVPAISGALLLVPRLAWVRVVDQCGEFFDEDFFAYREDAELGVRASAVGVRSVVVGRPVGLHFRGSPGTVRTNPTTNRLGVRNRFLILFKWGVRGRPGSIPLACFRDVVAVVGVVVTERSSWSGLTEAWRLRHRMQQKQRGFVRRLRRPSLTGVAVFERQANPRFDAGKGWRRAVVVPSEGVGDGGPLVSGVRPTDLVILVGRAASRGDGVGSELPSNVADLTTVVPPATGAAINAGLRWARETGVERVAVNGLVAGTRPSRDGDELYSWIDLAALDACGLLDETLPGEGSLQEFALRLNGKARLTMGEWRVAEGATDAVGLDGPDVDDYYRIRNAILNCRAHLRHQPGPAMRSVRTAFGTRDSARTMPSLRTLWNAVKDGLLGRRMDAPWLMRLGVPLCVPSDDPCRDLGTGDLR